MPAKTADVIVLGLGAMGSAAAQHLSERGCRVLGFDRFTPPHSYGSSHGQSRMYRQAYWEDPRYVPLLLRAFDLWHELDAQAGTPLFHRTGGLAIGQRDSELITRTLASAQQYGLPHTLLSGDELCRQYPVFTGAVAESPSLTAVLEANAGYVLPEATIQHQLTRARQHQAELHFDEAVLSWQSHHDSVTVQTSSGSYSAARLVITAGPWAAEVLRELARPLRVTRQVLFWFEPTEYQQDFVEAKLPVYLFEAPPHTPMVYGFPERVPGEGVKVALHGSDHVTDPCTVRRDVTAADEEGMRERLRMTLPALAQGRLLHAETCLYTMSPDEHFIVDTLPGREHIVVAAGFSGHGFKFTPVIGEVLADLTSAGETRWDLSLFRFGRFAR